MALLSPLATSLLSAKDHAFMHRVIDMDEAATEGILTIDSSDNLDYGSATVNAGIFSMIQGAVASDPTFSITQTTNDVAIAQTVGKMDITAVGEVVVNDAGADVDFRVEGVGVANALCVQGSDGKVGIGMVATAKTLDVLANMRVQSLTAGKYLDVITDSSGASIDSGTFTAFRVNGASALVTAMTIRTDSKVVVGSSSGDGLFNVVAGGASTLSTMYIDTYSAGTAYDSQIVLRHSYSNTSGTKVRTVTDSYLGHINFQGVSATPDFVAAAGIVARQDGATGTYAPTNLSFYTCSATAANSNQLVLHNDGNVGVGDDSPFSKLSVQGASTDGITVRSIGNNVGDYSAIYGMCSSSAYDYRKGGIFFERADAQGRVNIHLATTTDTTANSVTLADSQMKVTTTGEIQGSVWNDQRAVVFSSELLSDMTDPRLLLAFYGTPGDGTDEFDLSGSNNDAVYTSGSSWTSADKTMVGMINGLEFDGSDDYLTIASDNTLSFTDGADTDEAFSVSVWVYRTNATQNIISKWDETTGSEAREWQMLLVTGYLVFSMNDNSVATLAAPTIQQTTALTGWHHYCVTYDGSGGATAAGGLTMYVDGLDVSGTQTNAANYVGMERTGADVLVGCRIGTGGTAENLFANPMASVKVDGAELTSAQVWQEYMKGVGRLNKQEDIS